MIVNFRPSNLGLFGFPLQAHAREKKERKEKKEKRHSEKENFVENKKQLSNKLRNAWKTQTRLEQGPIVATDTCTEFRKIIYFDDMLS